MRIAAGGYVSASLNRAEGSKPRGPFGLPPLLGTIAAAVLFPFDEVLRGMVGAGLGIENLCLILGITRSFLDEQLVRLGLPTPNDKPMRKQSARAWSHWDRFRTIFWRKMGVHPEIIGLKVGRTAGAIRAQCRRMGIKAPSRKVLYKPDPATLRDPEHGSFWPQSPSSKSPANNTAAPTPESACGRVVGKITWRGRVEKEDFQGLAEAGSQLTVKASPTFNRSPQGELPIFGIIGGTDQAGKKSPAEKNAREIAVLPRPIPQLVIPQTDEEVDFNKVEWIGAIKRPLINKLAVWTLGILFLGGLHYTEVAKRIGKSPGAARTLRTRARIPVDEDRSKFGAHFDERVARETFARSGFFLQECRESKAKSRDERGNWFWLHKSDRANIHESPRTRKRDYWTEGRYDKITILKGKDALPPEKYATPFAKYDGKNSSNHNGFRSSAYA